MREGLYKAEFWTSNDEGYGLVHVVDGKVWGGDAMIYYTGTYRAAGDQVEIRIKADQYAAPPGFSSVLGRVKNTVVLAGTFTNNTAELEGRANENPGITVRARLTFLAG